MPVAKNILYKMRKSKLVFEMQEIPVCRSSWSHRPQFYPLWVSREWAQPGRKARWEKNDKKNDALVDTISIYSNVFAQIHHNKPTAHATPPPSSLYLISVWWPSSLSMYMNFCFSMAQKKTRSNTADTTKNRQNRVDVLYLQQKYYIFKMCMYLNIR